MVKKIFLVKILGSIALAMTLLGIFVAIGGNLNLFNQHRTPIKPMQSTEQSSSGNKPKYSFYDELKQRKTALEEKQEEAVAENNGETKQEDSDDNRLYLVQVGAFRDKGDAETVVAKLKKLGYQSKIVKPNNMHLVQTGPFKGKLLANSMEEKLKKDNFPTLIKRYNP